jgi:hypothetical protein
LKVLLEFIKISSRRKKIAMTKQTSSPGPDLPCPQGLGSSVGPVMAFFDEPKKIVPVIPRFLQVCSLLDEVFFPIL